MIDDKKSGIKFNKNQINKYLLDLEKKKSDKIQINYSVISI
jgi:hypothetical protein